MLGGDEVDDDDDDDEDDDDDDDDDDNSKREDRWQRWCSPDGNVASARIGGAFSIMSMRGNRP